jgi:2-hydroxychromene-2-carboxylate isomerase
VAAPTQTDALFVYDLGSPYAWLAAERIDDVLPAPAVWLPVLLGGIFKAAGRGSWAETDRRAAGIAEVERRAAERGLGEVHWPEPWPNNGLQAMRAAAHAHAIGAGKRFALAAFRVHFLEGRALTEPPAIAAAAERAELDPDELLATTADPAVKDTLRANTERALELGVIGVPNVVVGSDLFWGDDRLEEAAKAIAAR